MNGCEIVWSCPIGQRMVRVRGGLHRVGYEAVAGHAAHRVEDARVLHPARLDLAPHHLLPLAGERVARLGVAARRHGLHAPPPAHPMKTKAEIRMSRRRGSMDILVAVRPQDVTQRCRATSSQHAGTRVHGAFQFGGAASPAPRHDR
jgi:hypothetical protein